VIQNVADPQRTGRIGKVFELAKPRFRLDMKRDFRNLAIFPDRDRNHILNHWSQPLHAWHLTPMFAKNCYNS